MAHQTHSSDSMAPLSKSTQSEAYDLVDHNSGSITNVAVKSKEPLANVDVGLRRKMSIEVETIGGKGVKSGATQLARNNEASIDALAIRTYNIYSWIIAAIVYPLFFGIGVWFYIMSKNRVGTAMEFGTALALGDPNGDLRFIFVLVCISAIPTFIFLVALIAFFIRFWSSPEVRSRHLSFILQFSISSLLTVVGLFFNAMCTLGQTNLDFMSKQYVEFSFWGNIITNLGISMLLSSVVSRLRFMFLVFQLRTSEPRYWPGPLFHFILYWIGFTSFGYCHYADLDEPCSTVQAVSGGILFSGVLCSEYLFYLFFARKAGAYFVDWAANLRMFCVYFCCTWGPTIYILVDPDGALLVTYILYFMGSFLVWLFAVDNFTLLIIRVISRELGKTALQDVDCEGTHFRTQERARGLKELLGNSTTRDMFVKFAESRLCVEAVEFVMEVDKCRLDNPMNPEEVRKIVNTHIKRGCPKPINIAGPTKAEILRLMEGTSEIGEHYQGIFDEAYNEVSSLVSNNLVIGFLSSPEFLEFQRKQLENNRLLEVLYSSRLVPSDSRGRELANQAIEV